MADKLEDISKNTPIAPSGNVPKDSGNEYYLRKNRNFRIVASQIMDVVDGEYIINFTHPAPQFNTAFGKAYNATRKYGNGKELYAIILDKRYPIKLAEINKLMGHKFDNMVNILSAQVINTSVAKGRSFAVIIEKPTGITLSEYIKKNGKMSEEYISRVLIPAISGIIMSFAGFGVVHGKINADNIYIDDNGHITVGECVSESSGYSQPLIYETIGRACAMPFGKGTGGNLVDYHALGVLVSILLRGANPVEGLSDEEILNRKLEEGTYKIVTAGVEISPRIFDLLRGVLTERPMDAWESTQVQEWIKGRRFNLLPPSDNSESGRSIVFNGKKYTNRKHLVHALYMYWEEGKIFVKKDAIIKWIDRGPKDREIVEGLEMLSSRHSRERERAGFSKDDELLAQYILLLDPTGPIRMKDFSINIDGIGVSLAHGFATNTRHYIESVEDIILYNIVSAMASSDKEALQASAQEAIFAIRKCIDLLRKRDMGFGIERCLYELSPTLPCQSPQILDENIFTKEELLYILDKNESIGGKILDTHMTAFLTERMELLLRVHIPSLVRFPDFSSSHLIQVLALLSLVQQTSSIGSLPTLSAKIHSGLRGLVDEFHSKTVREELTSGLQKVEKQGILSQTLRIISDAKFLVRDRIGFKRARSLYQENAVQIIKLGNSKVVNNVGYRYGLQLAVMISFFVATVEIISLIIKAF